MSHDLNYQMSFENVKPKPYFLFRGVSHGGQIHIGKNEFEGFNMPIMVEELISYSSLKCYKVSSDMEIRNGELLCNTMRFNIDKLETDYPKGMKMIIASETNADGVVFTGGFVEGDVIEANFDLNAEPKTSTLVTMQQKNNEYLPLTSNCSTDNSIYQCVAGISLELIMNGTCPTKCIPPINKSVLKLATKESKLPLCDNHEDNFCLGYALLQKTMEVNELESCPKSCKQVDYYGNVKKTNSLERSWPEDMDVEVCYGFSTMHIKVDEEYLIYSFPDMVGAIGGSFGLFLGFSFLDQLFIFLKMLEQKLK